MNKTLSNLINDLQCHVKTCSADLDWYYERIKECEKKLLNLKETIAELQTMEREVV